MTSKHGVEHRFCGSQSLRAAQRVCEQEMSVIDALHDPKKQHHATLVAQHDIAAALEKRCAINILASRRDLGKHFRPVRHGVE